jgi:NAD(P)-dependent dehydrogenase (short-subunit alcohol dehydrogenase family)
MSKTVLITGANGNLGTAAVKKFLEVGYQVIGVDHSGSHLGFAESNQGFELQSIDLTDESAVGLFVKNIIAKYNTIDAALLLAGGFASGNLLTTGGDDLKKMYTLNFETVYFIAQPLFQHMLLKGFGRLVFIGARPALKAEQGKTAVAYALSKSLLFKLSEIMNAEAKGKNVVSSVVTISTLDTEQNRMSMPHGNPDNWVKVEQASEIMEFICSDKSLPLRESIFKVYNNA